MESNVAIRMTNITKTFGSVVANHKVSMDINRGEILSLLGENGSGKTTLMNMLSGIYYPDAGQIFVDGREVSIRSPKDAFDLGIGMIHQHFKLVDVFTAAENVILGLPEQGRINRKAIAQKVQAICDRYGFDIDPNQKVYDMTVSQKQTLEIVKVLYRGANVLILDEPTAGLDPAGRENLMANIRDYHRNKHKTIILVSHSMDEIAQNVDRILVLKGAHILMSGTPAEVFARGGELMAAGLDVPQVTRVAIALKQRGLDIDPAVYTVEALEAQLLALRKGGAVC